ncbi:MAG: DUF4832 domain-containing protein [SAR324 cluster bacterium]|nr:DUF4832 domain-containing protein [SAR324 cluster bacterium]
MVIYKFNLGLIGRLFVFLCLLAGCNETDCADVCNQFIGTKTSNSHFKSLSGIDIPNPQRGFYHHTETHSNQYQLLKIEDLLAYRQEENITLIMRVFYMEDFVNSDITQTYLDSIQADFNTIRDAAMHVIVRFAYTDELNNDRLPPFGDATKSRVLSHIDQLASVLQQNSDVIALIQSGFIGVYGEWYYTDHFVTNPEKPDNVKSTDYADRSDVVSALLSVIPENRMIQIRTPKNKQKILEAEGGRADAIVSTDYYNGSRIARIGHHNDCFLADETDGGTYDSINSDKTYLAQETVALPMGGETCRDTRYASLRSLCPVALKELARFHWSFLNVDYKKAVLESWDRLVPPHNCLDEVKQKLGYRFVYKDSEIDAMASPGSQILVNILLKNEGWAAPFNPRFVELLLRNISSGELYGVRLQDDPRMWFGQSDFAIEQTVCLPSNISEGEYELLLSLPDPETDLYSRPEYAIRLANENMWEDITGFNKLPPTITVLNSMESVACESELVLDSR